jgi:hypothetical protein
MSKLDIFDHFKEEADKIREMPSPEAWSRIEQRLQASRPSIQRARIKTMGPRLHPMSLAAGIALILGFAVIFMWMSDQQHALAPIAQTDTLEWEELSLTPTSSNATEVIAIATSHPQPLVVNPIDEGTSNQRLVAKKEVYMPSGNKHNQLDSARNVEERTSR